MSKLIPGILFIALVQLDTFLTLRCLAHGHSEANPIAFYTLQHPVARVVLPVLIVAGLHMAGKARLLVPLCVLMGLVCLWNLVALVVFSA